MAPAGATGSRVPPGQRRVWGYGHRPDGRAASARPARRAAGGARRGPELRVGGVRRQPRAGLDRHQCRDGDAEQRARRHRGWGRCAARLCTRADVHRGSVGLGPDRRGRQRRGADVHDGPDGCWRWLRYELRGAGLLSCDCLPEKSMAEQEAGRRLCGVEITPVATAGASSGWMARWRNTVRICRLC